MISSKTSNNFSPILTFREIYTNIEPFGINAERMRKMFIIVEKYSQQKYASYHIAKIYLLKLQQYANRILKIC